MKKIIGMLAFTGILIWGVSRLFSGIGAVPQAGPAVDPEGQVIEHFTLEGFQQNGERLWELVGDTAHVGKATDVFIEKNVILTVRGTTTIRGDKVYWRNNHSVLVTNQPVEITQGGHRIRGLGALARADDEFLQINRKIRMTLEGPIDITCHGPFQIYRKENRAVFWRGVKIVDSRGTVTADRMDLRFDEGEGRITQIIARGNVEIQRGENKSISDQAVYDTRTQSVRLIGAPKILIKEKDLVANQVK